MEPGLCINLELYRHWAAEVLPSASSFGLASVLKIFIVFWRNLQNNMRFCFSHTLSIVRYFPAWRYILAPSFYTFQGRLRVIQILISQDRIFVYCRSFSFILSCVLTSSLRKLSSFRSIARSFVGFSLAFIRVEVVLVLLWDSRRSTQNLRVRWSSFLSDLKTWFFKEMKEEWKLI